MITIKIADWVAIGGLVHTGTSYQVSTTIDFILANIVDDHPNDTVNLTIYYSPANVPVGGTYYVRVMRHFSNGTDSGWDTPIAVTDIPVNGGVLAYTPIKIFQPIVTADRNVINDPLQVTYTVTTSAFRSSGEGHGYTIWMILNDKNEVIKYVKSTVDLTSIMFTKGVNDLLNTLYIKIIAIHATSTNIESPVGELIIDVSTVNFTLVAPNTYHRAGANLDIAIQSTPNKTNNILTKVELTDLNRTVVWSADVVNWATSITIPGGVFLENTQYLLTGYGAPATAESSYTIPIDIMKDNILSNKDPSYVYKKIVVPGSGSVNYPHSTNLATTTMPNGDTLTLYNNRLHRVTHNADGSFTRSNIFLNGLLFDVTNNANILLKMLINNRIIIDYASVAGHYTGVYDIDYYNNALTLVAYNTVPGGPLSVNNGLVVVNETDFYTASDNNTNLEKRVIDNSTNTIAITNIALPTGETNIALIAKDVGSSVLVFCVGSGSIYSYDTTTGDYIGKYTLPLAFRDRTLKQEELVNGDTIIFKPIAAETVSGTLITDTVLDILYIDSTNNTITEIPALAGRNYDIDGAVVTRDGKVLLLTNAGTGNNVLTFE